MHSHRSALRARHALLLARRVRCCCAARSAAGWVSILDSLPDIDLLTHLPQFFDGLFHMLSDQNKEIRQQVRPPCVWGGGGAVCHACACT